LTPLEAASTIAATGGNIGITGHEPRAWNATITIQSGTFPQNASLRATPLTPQGLPLLLPLGWSPVVAFDLRADSAPSASLAASLTGVDGATVLVWYEADTHMWRAIQATFAPASGTVSADLAQLV